MHYYSFYLNDYKAATAHLTNGEDLAYRRVLDLYYELEGPIPLDTQRVSRRLRVSKNDLETVLNDHFIKTENGWMNERCESELQKYRLRQNNSRNNGLKGGRKPSRNPVGTHQPPRGNPEEPRPNPQEPDKSIINNQEDSFNTLLSSDDEVTPLSPSRGGTTRGRRSVDTVPYQEIVDQYNRILSAPPYNRPYCRLLDDKRKRLIKRIWDMSDKTKTLEWWEAYWQACTGNSHWMYGTKHTGGTWAGANLDFLLHQDRFKAVVEG